MRRLLLVLLPAGTFTAILLYVTLGWPWLVAHGPTPNPNQPIHFSHEVHVQVAKIECAFCHTSAEHGISAGMPDVEQCMFCHVAVAPENEEVQKVRQAWMSQQPIDWVRIHRLPDHTRFDHEAHAQAGVPCATCHGDVGQMAQVEQVRPLSMGDCVDCHQRTGAPSDCVVCHY